MKIAQFLFPSQQLESLDCYGEQSSSSRWSARGRGLSRAAQGKWDPFNYTHTSVAATAASRSTEIAP